MKQLTIIVALGSILVLNTNNFYGQDEQEVCAFIAEISLPAVRSGAFVGCYLANPVACEIAFAILACEENEACSGVIKSIVEGACTYTLSYASGSQQFRIVVATTSTLKTGQGAEIEKVWSDLNHVTDIYWIQNNLTN